MDIIKETFTKDEVKKLKARFNSPSPKPWRLFTKEETETLKHHDTVILEKEDLLEIVAVAKRYSEEDIRITADIDNTLSDGVKVLNTLYTYDNNPTIPGFSTEISCTIEGEKIGTCVGMIAYAIDLINEGKHSKYYKAEFRCFPKGAFDPEVNKFVVLLSTPGHYGYYDKQLYFNPKTKKLEISDVSESWR